MAAPAQALGPGGSSFVASMALLSRAEGRGAELFSALELPRLESGGWEPDMVRLRVGWRREVLGGGPAAFQLELEGTIGMLPPVGGAPPRPDQQLQLTLEKSFGGLRTGIELGTGALGGAALSRTQDGSTAMLLRAEYPLGSFGNWRRKLVLRYAMLDLDGPRPHGLLETRFELGEGKDKLSLGVSHAEASRETRAELRLVRHF